MNRISSAKPQAKRPEVPVKRLDVSVYRVPTDGPESDGTLEWNATTLVLVEAFGGERRGLGYTYASGSTASLIRELLTDRIVGLDAMNIQASWIQMIQAIRNLGRPGICSMAIAAVDSALWDLKARLLELPLVTLLGAARAEVPVYGSGGFTSYSIEQLQSQLGAWVEHGIARVKMKIGRDPQADIRRVQAAREAIGPKGELFVDANGAYSLKQALAQASAFSAQQVAWFEEPVSSDDLAGLRFVREHAPAGMEISAGEYGYDLCYFRRMLEAGSVDVIQPDATRCAGITGFLQVGALAQAFACPISAHTAPSLHLHPCCAVPGVRHLEYFHDHARIEHLFFEGTVWPLNGSLAPDLSRPGFGLEFKRADAQRYALS